MKDVWQQLRHMGTNGHVDRGEGAVGDGAAQGAGEGEARVEVDALGGLLGGQGNW